MQCSLLPPFYSYTCLPDITRDDLHPEASTQQHLALFSFLTFESGHMMFVFFWNLLTLTSILLRSMHTAGHYRDSFILTGYCRLPTVLTYP